jgi:hypothetical protein
MLSGSSGVSIVFAWIEKKLLMSQLLRAKDVRFYESTFGIPENLGLIQFVFFLLEEKHKGF